MKRITIVNQTFSIIVSIFHYNDFPQCRNTIENLDEIEKFVEKWKHSTFSITYSVSLKSVRLWNGLSENTDTGRMACRNRYTQNYFRSHVYFTFFFLKFSKYFEPFRKCSYFESKAILFFHIAMFGTVKEQKVKKRRNKTRKKRPKITMHTSCISVIEWKKNEPKWLEFIGCACTQFNFVRFAFLFSLFFLNELTE